MKEFIYNEMMVHVPLCTHKEPKNVLIISSNAAGLVTEVQRYMQEISCDVISAEINLLREVKDSNYDVVISEMKNDAAVLAHINRILKDDGLCVIDYSELDDVDVTKNILQILGKYAKIIMPYHRGNCKSAVLASKKYHPTADIILNRSDLIDGLNYYNTDIHIAAFAMGNYIKKEYLGIIKN